MKKTVFILVLILSVKSYAQTVVTDPALYGVLVTNTAVHKSSLNAIRSEQRSIKGYKATIAGLTANINRIQTKVQTSLTKVQSVVSQGQNVIQASSISLQIKDYQKKAYDIAVQDPVLLALAYKLEINLLNKTYELGTYIISALKGGEGNMMTNMERMKIINRVVDELKAMRGLSYSVWLKFKYGRNGSLLKKIALEHNINLFLLDDLQKSNIRKKLKVW